jgi:hypothetical protein
MPARDMEGGKIVPVQDAPQVAPVAQLSLERLPIAPIPHVCYRVYSQATVP